MISEDDLKKGEEELQKITDRYIEEINADWRAKREGDFGSLTLLPD